MGWEKLRNLFKGKSTEKAPQQASASAEESPHLKEDSAASTSNRGDALDLPPLVGDSLAAIHLRKGTFFKEKKFYAEAAGELSSAIAHAEFDLRIRTWAHIERSMTTFLSGIDSGLDDLDAVLDDFEIPGTLRGYALFERARRLAHLDMAEKGKADIDELLASPEIDPPLRANAIYIRGLIALECLETESAIRDFESAIVDPLVTRDNGLHCRLLLAQALMARQRVGDVERAHKECSRVMVGRSVPQWLHESAVKLLADLRTLADPLSLQSQINDFVEAGDFTNAIYEYTAILSADRIDVEARLDALSGRAYAFSAQGDTAKEIADLSFALQVDGISAEDVGMFTCRRGLAMVRSEKSEDLSRADEEFGAALQIKATSEKWRAAAMYGRGLVAFHEEDWGMASSYFGIALRFTELEQKFRIDILLKQSEAYRILGNLGNRESELGCYRLLLENTAFLTNEQLAYVHASREACLRYLENTEELEKEVLDLDTIIARAERFSPRVVAEAYYNRALRTLSEEDIEEDFEYIEEIVDDFSEALAIPELPDNFRPIAHYKRGLLQGDYFFIDDEMIADMTACIDSPHVQPDLRAMALVKRAQGYEETDINAALADYEEAISSLESEEEQLVSVLQSRSRTLLKVRDFDGAIRDCSLVLESKVTTKHRFAGVTFTRGEAYQALDKLHEAIADFQFACSFPEAPIGFRALAHFHLGEIYQKRGEPGDLAAAKEHLAQALDLDHLPSTIKSDANAMLDRLRGLSE